MNGLMMRRRMMMMADSRPAYLRFTATAANSTVQLTAVGSPDAVSLEYALDGGTFVAYTIGDTITLANVGDYVEMRHAGSSPITQLSKSANDCYKFVMTGTIAASGNVMSLLDASCESVTVGAYCFLSLFRSCPLVSAPLLPATTLSSHCYRAMFNGCSSLVTPPALPATTLAQYCYYTMFNGCTSLVSAPALPATTLTSTCYYYMFQNCKALTSAGHVAATGGLTIANCMSHMFEGCTSLETTSFASIGSASGDMFKNNSSAVSLTIEATTPPTIASNTITGLKADCAIYVPAESVAAYKAAQYWSARASYIQAIPT